MPTDAPAPKPQSFLIREAAQLLGVSRRTIYYRIREGLLLTVRARCGSQRVLMASIEEMLLTRPRSRPPAPGASRRVPRRTDARG